MRFPRILALVLAGGEGSRLEDLTGDRPKPTLPIGGSYALIDVALSNLVHSHLEHVWVVEQFKADRLNAYLKNGRAWDLDRSYGGLTMVPPFQGGKGEGFAQGNADSLARQLTSMRAFGPEHVLVLSADHLYRLNFLDVVQSHEDAGADLTIVTTERTGDVSRYGVVEVDESGRVTDLAYKPEGRQDGTVLTEVFLYRAEALFAAIETLLDEHDQLHDYGDELLPYFLEHGTVGMHDLDGYWMDLGTLQSYWTANLQLVNGDAFDLADEAWPLLSAQPQRGPAVLGQEARVGKALVASGATVNGRVEHSIVGLQAEVAAGAVVRDSVLLEGVVIGPDVAVHNCIVDAGAHVRGPADLGRAGYITLIDSAGQVSKSVGMDKSAPLPRSQDELRG